MELSNHFTSFGNDCRGSHGTSSCLIMTNFCLSIVIYSFFVYVYNSGYKMKLYLLA